MKDPRDTPQQRAVLHNSKTAQSTRRKFPTGTRVVGSVGGQHGVVWPAESIPAPRFRRFKAAPGLGRFETAQEQERARDRQEVPSKTDSAARTAASSPSAGRTCE